MHYPDRLIGDQSRMSDGWIFERDGGTRTLTTPKKGSFLPLKYTRYHLLAVAPSLKDRLIFTRANNSEGFAVTPLYKQCGCARNRTGQVLRTFKPYFNYFDRDLRTSATLCPIFIKMYFTHPYLYSSS